MDLSKETVMAAIMRQQMMGGQPQRMPADPQQPPADMPPQQPQPNVLQRFRNRVLGGDSTRAAYQAYALQQMENGQAPLPFDEWQRQQQAPRNALRDMR